MHDQDKSKTQLIKELEKARKQTDLLEKTVSNLRKEKNTFQLSQALYQSLMEHSLDGVYIHDLEGYFSEANPAALKMLGYTKDDIQSVNMSALISDEQLSIAEQQNQDLIETGTYDEGLTEFRLKRKDGSHLWVETKGSMIYLDGKPHSVIGVARDITQRREILIELAMYKDHLEKIVKERTQELAKTNEQLKKEMAERKRAEEELIKASKLESLGVFAGGIAHDFNNLLTAIVGSISLAKQHLKSKDQVHSLLSSAEMAAMRTKDLTMQLLTFSKGGTPIKKVTSLRSLLKETTTFILRGSSIKSELNINDELWNANVDPGQLSQVIYNMIINARQAMPDGGTILIKASNIVIDHNATTNTCSPGKFVMISIQDSGVGIRKEHLSKVFDPYFTTRKNGSGLGLAVSYSIIKNHSGHLEVDSRLNQGSTFTIYLPATTKSISIIKKALRQRFHASGKVLIMDDEDLVLETASSMLAQLGFNVTCAHNSKSALKHYEQALEQDNPYDLVIMDLTIPGDGGGREFIQTIRKVHPDVQAIVSSGYSNNPIMSNYKAYGFAGVLTKPYNFEELIQALTQVLGG